MSQILPFLFLGDFWDAQDEQFFDANEIGFVVNAAGGEIEEPFRDRCAYMNLELDDEPTESIEDVFERTFCFIDKAREMTDRKNVMLSEQGQAEAQLTSTTTHPSGSAVSALAGSGDTQDSLHAATHVLVHCAAGMSRSATIVLAYVMRAMEWNLRKAFEHVKTQREIIAPNEGFIRQLIAYELELYNTTTLTDNETYDPHTKEWTQYDSNRMIGGLDDLEDDDVDVEEMLYLDQEENEEDTAMWSQLYASYTLRSSAAAP